MKYIDKDKIRYRCKFKGECESSECDACTDNCTDVLNIESIPTIDIVFCDNCESCCHWEDNILYCIENKRLVFKDAFCKWGKEKSNGNV